MSRSLPFVILLALPGLTLAQDDPPVPVDPVGQENVENSQEAKRRLVANILHDLRTVPGPTPGPEIGVWSQFRFAALQRDTFPRFTSKRTTTGASIPRSRVFFRHDFFDLGPSLPAGGGRNPFQVHLSGNFDSATGDFLLHDATATFRVCEGVRLTAGQYTAPWLMEQSVQENRMLFATHSPVGEAFSQGLSQGIVLDTIPTGGLPHAMLSINDGFGSVNTEFGDEFADINITGRVNFYIEPVSDGALWGDYFLVESNEFATGFPGSDFGAMVGAAAFAQFGGSTASGPGGTTTDRNQFGVTIDGRIGGDGVVAQAALVYVNTDVSVGDSNDFGMNFQVGYFIDTQWQLFAGADLIVPDDELVPGARTFVALRLGFNHYFFPGSHAAKATFQVNYFDDAVTSGAIPSVGGGQGVFGTGSGNDLVLISETGSPQIAIMGQIQVEVR